MIDVSRQETIFTVGHSTHRWEEFLAILRCHEIGAVADVRRFPGSRNHPQFKAATLETALPKSGIDYLPFRELGGRRSPVKASMINAGWRSAAFRGYADFMQSDEFAAGIDRLEETARRKATAIMCAEAVPWRCHRSLIADALLVRGWQVLDIFGKGPAKEHVLNPMALVSDGKIVYPLTA
jgi:uncharacterized protein (DUF488 family)